MAVNSRISFVIENNPTLIWQKVPNSTVFSLKMVDKNSPETSIWEREVPVDELSWNDEGGYFEFKYPKGAPRLEPLVSYLIMGETDNGEGIKSAQGEIMLLESGTQETVKSLDDYISSEQPPEFQEQWNQTLNAIFMSPFETGNDVSWGQFTCGRLRFD